MEWEWLTFDELGADTLYEILKIRQTVFILEQNCQYQDADNLDRAAWHLIVWERDARSGEKEIAGYLRVVFPGRKYEEPAIGRVLTAASHRGKGLGKQIMAAAMERIDQVYGKTPVRISAQKHLEDFYRGFGFNTVSAPYDDAGIPHIEMLRP